MLKYFGVYAAVFASMVVIDMIWLRLIAVQWYADSMGPLLSNSPNLWAAAAFYLLFPVGLLIFAVFPSEDTSVIKAVIMGALFGFFAYATYDLTALAVIKGWPVGLTFLDMAWGTLVSGVSAGAGKFTLDYLNK
jgi:uncharacterized membrane protein